MTYHLNCILASIAVKIRFNRKGRNGPSFEFFPCVHCVTHSVDCGKSPFNRNGHNGSAKGAMTNNLFSLLRPLRIL